MESSSITMQKTFNDIKMMTSPEGIILRYAEVGKEIDEEYVFRLIGKFTKTAGVSFVFSFFTGLFSKDLVLLMWLLFIAGMIYLVCYENAVDIEDSEPYIYYLETALTELRD